MVLQVPSKNTRHDALPAEPVQESWYNLIIVPIMGLVDYSDSDSDSEVAQKLDPQLKGEASSSKKPSSNPIARSSTGRILVSLPSASTNDGAASSNDEPPAKRARIGAGAGSSRFSGFGSFLPPPKVTKPVASQTPRANAPRPGVHLKTGAEPAFSRESDTIGGDEDTTNSGALSGLNLPPPKASSGPSIPEGQKPEEEVELVGKPLMFRPLSVTRKPTKKKRIVPGAVPKQPPAVAQPEPKAVVASGATDAPVGEVAKKKISLFSMGDEASTAVSSSDAGGVYEPLFPGDAETDAADIGAWPDQGDEPGFSHGQQPLPLPAHQSEARAQAQSLSSIADDLNLSKKARRELFGRGGPNDAGAKIVNFSMEREYEHNEALRSSGEQQAYNPVRTIAPGKHNLRQLITAAQNNQSALQDSYAAGRSNKREAGAKYGWG